jgi:hypothetical protein
MNRPCVVALIAVLATGFATAPAAAAPVGETWQVDLTRPVARSTVDTLAPPMTYTRYRRHTLRAPANSFTATVDGPVSVDIRGRRADGRWTEWTELPAMLDTVTTLVEVRTVATPGAAAPSRLSVSASVSESRVARDSELSYEIFATREGLVGGTTASGHVIVENDHFVALPSRRGLSSMDNGDYTVRVCAENGRCEWAPVWDVGPWNTKDDHWNPADTRQMWTDLPQGKPQAQAAKLDGYNGGLDQFGRTVRNPAGIDLADGTFWDGLQLAGNSWITVSYLWTGSGPTGIVDAPVPLNVRAAPTREAAQVGLAANLAHVRIQCLTHATTATGTQGTTDIWYRLTPTHWISAAYVSGLTEAPPC